ncbi:MAG: hypothetical protein IJL90_05045 [Lachnospiraceae bacterium]|nr:hypothetical protein [Lachnospiraceae bacterium]
MIRTKSAVFPVTVILLIALSVATLSGCSSPKSDINCPFSEMSWDSTADDMIEAEGEGFDTYDSIYKGLTYTYPKEYLGNTGMIKYMYDDAGKLCNVSWSYTGDSDESVMNIYRDVVEEMKDLHGESKSDDGIGNYCEIWVTENGTVMANAVITNDAKVMQIAYMNPEVSKQTNQ